MPAEPSRVVPPHLQLLPHSPVSTLLFLLSDETGNARLPAHGVATARTRFTGKVGELLGEPG